MVSIFKLLKLSFCLFLCILFSQALYGELKINEFLALNDSILADPQGDYDDWVELYNAGSVAVDLGGMYLTDDVSDPTRWTVPEGTQLAAGQYLLIWADKDTSDNPNGLHAGFKLSKEGESLSLFAADGATLIDSINFGDQASDVSYGRYPNGDGQWFFMSEPTPLGSNAPPISEAVYFSKLGGVVTNSFTLKLSTPSNLGDIRYTVDGSEPTESSALYENATGIYVENSKSRRIRARNFETGKLPGPIRTEGYIALSPTLRNFNSNLPIIIIETFNQEVVRANPIAAYVVTFDLSSDSARVTTLETPDYRGRVGINLRGFTTSAFPKKPYKIETWNENNEDLDVSLLGMPADSDWVLRNPYSDKTLMRDALTFELSNRMKHYAPSAKHVEVFFNADGGQVGGQGSNDYMGVYILVEKIKRGKGRIEIEKLKPSDDVEPEITGGYILKRDRKRSFEDAFNTWAGQWLYVEPSYTEITQAQKDYIKGYIEEFETVLRDVNYDDPINGYAKYIDVKSFIDHDLISQLTKEVDAYMFSMYMTKDRNGKLKMSPEWDFNWSMGNNDYRTYQVEDLHHAVGWNERARGRQEYRWHARLMTDLEYLMRYTDRWFDLRETVLSDDEVARIIDRYFQQLNLEAVGRNFSRWDILNSWIGFGWSYPGPTFYYGGNPDIPCSDQDHTFGMQVEWLKNWLTGKGSPSGSCAIAAFGDPYSDRLGWIDANIEGQTGFSPPPTIYLNGILSNTGGILSGNDLVEIEGGGGEIYYTLDGSDPREAFTGNAIGTLYHESTSTTSSIVPSSGSSKAKIFKRMSGLGDGFKTLAIDDLWSGAGSSDLLFESGLHEAEATTKIQNSENGIALTKTVDLRVREKNGTTWSAINRAVFTDGKLKDDLRITEIMYNPDSAGGEFIELTNIASQPVNLYLCEFIKGVEFTFPDIQLNPSESVLVVENQAEFEDMYGAGFVIAGEFENGSGLSNDGEKIVLCDAAGREIHNFYYKDWYPVTDGHGFSLCTVNPRNPDINIWDEKAGWRMSQSYGGNPGAARIFSGISEGSIVINEILTHSDALDSDWIELHNTTNEPIDVSGWFLSDDLGMLKKYQISHGTVIQSNGYRVFTQIDNFGVGASDAGSFRGFSLSKLGGNIFLSSGSGSSLSGDYSISQTFGTSQKGVTLGRYTKSSLEEYAEEFVAMESPTLASLNSGPLIPRIVIKEILYNSVAGEDEITEYLELYNRSSETIYLYDLSNPSNTWKFTSGIEFIFPEGVSIPSGGHILVVRTDPDIFRYLYNIPTERPIYGPYGNALGNDQDSIELSMPGVPETSSVPYIALERIKYKDGSSNVWPSQPNSLVGYSLQRESSTAYGNDAINWGAAISTPFTPDVRMIKIDTKNGLIQLRWVGAGGLRSSDQLFGPWVIESDLKSPYTIDPNQASQKFFKLGD